ncbi:MAG: hypothetical protein IPN95_24780 [Bacteroidetes bacterium]|nr:hypothetical protein [Bacteroidota bacterium]
METRRDIAFDRTITFIQYLLQLPELTWVWDREKQKLNGNLGGQTWSFRMPLPWPNADKSVGLLQYLDNLPSVPLPYFLIIMQAGHSALAYFEDGEMRHHKVIKKYMVRGNGKAQVGYLQTRGKSKAGSRIRLANTVSFFEDINEKLTEWDVADEAARILVSCPISLQSLWFESRIQPPFSKDDPRLLKVPVDVHRPDLEELERVNRIIQRGRWEGPVAVVDNFFSAQRLEKDEFEED